jgi:nitrogen fixation NifU-like protein
MNYFASLYSQKVMKELKNPQNMGKLKNPDGVGMVGNPVCGDIMKIYIKVKKGKADKEYIKDIKFQTLGCGAAIATSSMITKLVKGKNLTEAQKVSGQTLAKALGGLPSVKMHCSVLADKALKKAIENYKKKSKKRKRVGTN